MRAVRIGLGLAVALFCICFEATPQGQKVTLTGKLIRAMAIGGESTGWAIQLESKIDADGKQIDSIEVEYHESKKLEALKDKRVRASGTLLQRHGMERGTRYILDVAAIREVKGHGPRPAPVPMAFNLTDSEWLLEDLAGRGVMDSVQATLAFREAGKVSGSGSCNRFFGPAEVEGNVIKLGPLGSTRMACAEAVMNQEARYLNALQAAERFEWQDPYLLLYCRHWEKPLRFTRQGK